MISMLSHNSTLFVEPYVSYPRVVLPVLIRPLLAAPAVTPGPVYSATFVVAALTLDLRTSAAQ